MKKNNILALVFGVFLFLIALASCSKNKYGEKIYSDIQNDINENIFLDNKIKGVHYDDIDDYYNEEGAPTFRLFTIDTQQDYDFYFKNDNLSVDYESERLYLYIFGDIYLREYKISSVSKDENKLNIKIKIKHSGLKDAVAPYARAVAIKMKKLEVSEINIKVSH